jgi:hypothetical protein
MPIGGTRPRTREVELAPEKIVWVAELRRGVGLVEANVATIKIAAKELVSRVICCRWRSSQTAHPSKRNGGVAASSPVGGVVGFGMHAS